jgi:hypothetical protein
MADKKDAQPADDPPDEPLPTSTKTDVNQTQLSQMFKGD